MRVRDAAPQDETRYPEATRIFWGHDYGTRGEETPGRPFIGETSARVEGFFYRVGSWVRGIVR